MSLGPVIAALLAVACFAFVLVRSGVIAVAGQIPDVASSGVTKMLDPDFDDDAKEAAVKQAGLKLVSLSWQVFWRIALSLAAVFPPILAADLLGLAARDDSFDMLMRVDFIVIVSVLALAVAWVVAERAKAQVTPANTNRITDASAYGAGDRLLHALAFSGPGVQKSLARIDDRLYRRQIEQVADAPPIFITSLARGGTTALLNAMHDLPGIATHRYCDMPFITAPMLWNRIAGLRTEIATRERAHGDGIEIGLQSPEAFDEIFWMIHWPEKYSDSGIALWQASDAKAEAQAFFLRHFRKITLLRQQSRVLCEGNAAAPMRYLSKNNANIARLALLPDMFPGCQILVPLREPSAHAASLYRQHQNFSRLHLEDSFSKRYMRDIGHYEFGSLHRVISFDTDNLVRNTPDHPDYWLAYWIACFEHVSRQTDVVSLVAQETLRTEPQQTMDAITDKLGLKGAHSREWASHFVRDKDIAMDHFFDSGLLERARGVYSDLFELRMGGPS